jgi:uncharacterized protein (DUF2249 family)
MSMSCIPVTNYRFLDVTDVPVSERTLHVLQAFEGMSGGNSFVLVCDSDPHRIHLQLRADSPNLYDWVELEPGPIWRILISKKK